ncbi:MAG TPA: protein-glutamate O-methyltransferase CheR [Chloroflexota bacterium]|nr:protein-glutamate O-methyltransferase CheR [Chloroflexota bacterium]
MSAAPLAEELDYQRFLREVRGLTGIDLASYQPEQLQRRLECLFARHNVAGYAGYLRLLEVDPERLRQFRDFVTINVSEFFRPPDRFAELRQAILPRLLVQRPRLRVWSAGCSFGAEAYSLALLLLELTPGSRHHILATDVDDRMLTRAAAADDFSAWEVRNVPRRERYFTPRGECFALDEDIRGRVTFRRHDLLTDTFDRDFDLIVCRNVMMYFTPAAKTRLASSLYQAMRAGGYLFTGSVEALEQLPEAGFAAESGGLYRK